MNLAILNTQQQEQKAIEEMKKYTDLFREEKSLDQTAVIELKNTDRDGYFITERMTGMWWNTDACRICAVHCFFFQEWNIR